MGRGHRARATSLGTALPKRFQPLPQASTNGRSAADRDNSTHVPPAARVATRRSPPRRRTFAPLGSHPDDATSYGPDHHENWQVCV